MCSRVGAKVSFSVSESRVLAPCLDLGLSPNCRDSPRWEVLGFVEEGCLLSCSCIWLEMWPVRGVSRALSSAPTAQSEHQSPGQEDTREPLAAPISWWVGPVWSVRPGCHVCQGSGRLPQGCFWSWEGPWCGWKASSQAAGTAVGTFFKVLLVF